MKRSKVCTFKNAAAARRMAAHYRKQFGLGLDGKPRYKKKKIQPIEKEDE